MKHRTDGELDDARLTESLTGEVTVYKHRGVAKPELGSLGSPDQVSALHESPPPDAELKKIEAS